MVSRLELRHGQVDWLCISDLVLESGFTVVPSVEQEDPVWDVTPEKVKAGLQIACSTSTSLVYPAGKK